MTVNNCSTNLSENILGAMADGFLGELHIKVGKVVKFLYFGIFACISVDGFDNTLAICFGVVQERDNGAVFNIPVWKANSTEAIRIGFACVAGS